MKCEYCGQEIEGNYIEYNGKYFHRFSDDECFRNWLYEQTDGDCTYGRIMNGEAVELTPEWSENYLNSLGMSKSDF